MPIYQPKRKVKVVCKKCGYEYYVEVGGYGDVIGKNPGEVGNFLNTLLYLTGKCPKCGAKNDEIEPETDFVE